MTNQTGSSQTEQGAGAGAGADEGRIYAELVDARGRQLWLSGDGEGLLGIYWAEAEGSGPRVDPEQALILSDALTQFSRSVRAEGSAARPVVPVGMLAVAVSRAEEKGAGRREDGSLDAEVFAQALLDELGDL